jgi:hypothetical protein
MFKPCRGYILGELWAGEMPSLRLWPPELLMHAGTKCFHRSFLAVQSVIKDCFVFRLTGIGHERKRASPAEAILSTVN